MSVDRIRIVGTGLLSTDKPASVAVPILHQITPYLTVLTGAIALYLLAKR